MKNVVIRLRRVCVALFAAVLALTVFGCGDKGPKPEDEVRQVIENTMAIFQNPASDDTSSILKDVDMSSLENYGIDGTEFLTYAFKHLTYTIDEVAVDGDTATAKMTITNVKLDAAMDAALEEFDTWTDTDEAMSVYKDEGENGLYKKLFSLLYAQIEKMGDGNTVTSEATLSLVKQEGGSWDVTEDGNDGFYSALYGGSKFEL